MELCPITPESLSKAAEIIRSGGLVAFPTETVYGLGADAFNPAALTKIFEAKGRPFFDPLIIHIAAAETLEETACLSILSSEMRKKLLLLIENLWPGPLSVVLPKSDKIPGIATAGLTTAAFRCPAHESARALISLSTGAIAAPSANPFGALSPTMAHHVREGLGAKVDLILDGGRTQIGVESTVVDFSGEVARILRHGGAPKEAIERLIGNVEDISASVYSSTASTSENTSGFASPGQLKSHYAPRTPLSVFSLDELIKDKPRSTTEEENQENTPCNSVVKNNGANSNAVYLFFDDASRLLWQERQGECAFNAAFNAALSANIKTLSPSGNLTEAAACLFETLHELDNERYVQIYAQLVPNEGLGVAINDRLKRAACEK